MESPRNKDNQTPIKLCEHKYVFATKGVGYKANGSLVGISTEYVIVLCEKCGDTIKKRLDVSVGHC